MPKESFADRLKLAMEQQGFKQVDLVHAALEQNVKLGKSHVSQYVSGKPFPGRNFSISWQKHCRWRKTG